MEKSSNLIQVAEVIKQSDQGVTRPFICRDEAGRQLWVKGAELTKPELAAEWVCARLAQAWGLPLAACGLAYIDPVLIEYSSVAKIASLGSGIGFGSYHVDGAIELDYSAVSDIAPELGADILLFDYWIRNEDRTLGKNGGNPNLLLQAPEGNLVMIDHNLAFDSEFSAPKLFGSHVFRDCKRAWTVEYARTRQEKMLDILGMLPNILSSIPDEWFADDEFINTPLWGEVERMEHILRRVEMDSRAFWEVPHE